MQERLPESFPIRTVAEITGVNPVTLRAWERRYGLIKPERTPKGHRLYSQDDIDKIEQIIDRLAQGMTISQIARELQKIEASGSTVSSSDTWSQYIERMISAIARFDEQKLDSVYNEAMSLYPVEVITTHLVLPLLQLLGARWQNNDGSVAEEHFFSVYLRNKLGARFHHQNLSNTGPTLIMACLPGEHHEFGILLFALIAHSKGYRIILLGANLPLGELKQVAMRTDSQAIVLAGATPLECSRLIKDIHTLTDMVSIPVFIGGTIATRCRKGIEKANAIPLSSDFSSGLYAIANVLQH
jgi:DNA-binding transcriptional MerR regulator/methylmalonyl-CoA mutase cobalamin-binding subunit